MSKPSELPLWADTASGGDISAPTTGKKHTGWTSGEAPPHNWFNWWQNNVYLWAAWLDAFESTAHTWSAAQVGLTVTPTFVYPSLVSGASYISHHQKLGYWLGVNGEVHIDGTVSFDVALTAGGSLTLWTASTLTAYLTTDGDSSSNVSFPCMAYKSGNGHELATVPCVARIRYDGSLSVTVASDEMSDGGTSPQSLEGVDIHIVYHPVLAIEP